jgi:hypothetical protein
MRGKYYECRYVKETLPCYCCDTPIQFVHVVGVEARASAAHCAGCAEKVLLSPHRGITPFAERLMRDRVARGNTQPVTESQVAYHYLT